jgi:hypothetical protein
MKLTLPFSLATLAFGGAVMAQPPGSQPSPFLLPTLSHRVSPFMAKEMKRLPEKIDSAALASNNVQLAAADEPKAAKGDSKEAQAKEAAEQKAASFQRLRQILKNEPAIKEVQQASLKFYKLEPERLARMGRAARAKGLVPDFQASIDNSTGNTYTNMRDGLYPGLASLDPNGNPGGYKERTAQSQDNLTWHLSATFYLDRLVFNSEELDVRSLNSLEENLVREVTTLFYARQRLISSLLLAPPEEDEEIFYELLKLDEMTATIDALTGGMFAPKAWKWEKDLAAN